MAKYQLVEEPTVEHKNEYFEIRFDDRRPSLFFTTNEENLETTAKTIVAAEATDAGEYHVIPHRKH